jgi:mono/diheme cytochrome c family protein
MKRRKGWATAVLAAGLALLATFGWLTRPQSLTITDLPAHKADPKNGKRLFLVGGCSSCHGESLGGGREIVTRFGTFRVPNISPDLAHGIGGWGPINFVNAMKYGVSPAGEHYYPAFPYTSYTRMSLTDLLDLKAWLDRFDPVPVPVAGHDLKFPWTVRRGIGLWKLRYLKSGPIAMLASDSPQLERGRYLVEAVGHCGECHTSRDWFGGLRLAYWLAGARSPDGEGRVPNITPDADGLAD